MVRIPRDPHNPSYDDVIEVSWRQLAAAPKEQRREWERRQREATLRAGAARRAARRGPDATAARQMRRVNRWSAAASGLYTVALVAGVVAVLLVVGLAVWLVWLLLG